MRTVSNTLERNLPCAWPPLPLSSVPARSPEEFEEATSCGQIQKVWGVCVCGGDQLFPEEVISTLKPTLPG